jgi:hypothetical protein
MRAVPLGAWIVAIVLGSASTGRAVVPITSCDQKVLAGETGVLQNDVVCDFRCTEDRSIVCGFDDRDTCVGKGACSAETLVLRQRGVLDLNGTRCPPPTRTTPSSASVGRPPDAASFAVQASSPVAIGA